MGCGPLAPDDSSRHPTVGATIPPATVRAVAQRGKPVLALATDGRNSDVVYAGTEGWTVDKSADGGKTWVSVQVASPPSLVGLGGFPVVLRGWHCDVRIDPNNSNTILFRIMNNLYRSLDGGSTWQDMSSKSPPTVSPPGGETMILSFEVADQRGATIVFAGTSEGLFRSRDLCETWIPSDQGILDIQTATSVLPVRRGIESVKIKRSNPDVVFATHMYGMERSLDGGLRWSRVAQMTFGSSYTLSIGGNPDRLFFHGGPYGVMVTDDDGASWYEIGQSLQQAFLPPPSTVTDQHYLFIQNLAVDPTSADVIYIPSLEPRYLYRTPDAGRTWEIYDYGGQIEHNPRDLVQTLVVDPFNRRRLFIAVDSRVVTVELP